MRVSPVRTFDITKAQNLSFEKKVQKKKKNTRTPSLFERQKEKVYKISSCLLGIGIGITFIYFILKKKGLAKQALKDASKINKIQQGLADNINA